MVKAESPIAVVPTPFTAAGAVSAGDLEKYVRWLRAAPIKGVLLWTRMGGGHCLDTTEREELYAVWRAGLLPHHQVWVQVPVGGLDVNIAEISFQATHARELGVDGIVTLDRSLAHLRPIVEQTPVVDFDPNQPHNPATFSYAAAIQGNLEGEAALTSLDDEKRAGGLLGILQSLEIISVAGSLSPGGLRSESIDPALYRLISAGR